MSKLHWVSQTYYKRLLYVDDLSNGMIAVNVYDNDNHVTRVDLDFDDVTELSALLSEFVDSWIETTVVGASNE